VAPAEAGREMNGPSGMGAGAGGKGLPRSLEELGPGDHLCCIYGSEEEHRALLVPFLRQGLQRGEKVIYITDAHTAEEVLGWLEEDGWEVGGLLGSGRLTVLTREDAYMRGGSFDPRGMIGLLEEETERALAEGYPCLRVTGEMGWALRGIPGSELLLEYESELNRFFPGSRCLAICQYDRRSFPPETLLGVLNTHPVAVVGTDFFDNFYFVPPDEFRGPGRAAAEFERRLRNLEERSRLMRELVEEQQKFALAFLSSPDPMALTRRRDGMFMEVNRAFEEFSGYRREEALGRTSVELGLFADRAGREEVVGRLSGGQVRDAEVTLRDRWGEEHVGMFSAEPVLLGGEECLITSFKDLTETRRALEELTRERDFARSLIESTPAYFVAIDASYMVLMMNPAMLEELGWREEEVVGLPYLQIFVPEEEREEVRKVFQDLIHTDRPILSVNRVRARDGRELLVEWHGRRVRGGEDGFFFGVGIDITERVRRDRELERLNADLAAFAHTLSHELRGPLTAALGYAHTLVQMTAGKLEPLEEEVLRTALQSLEKTRDIIDGMLEYVRLEGEQGQAVEVDLERMVGEVLEGLRAEGALEGVEVRAEALGRVRAEPLRLRQVLSNLISNAVKFSSGRPGARVRVGCREEEGRRMVFVEDNGPGIAPEDLERVFEPLVRTEDARGLPGHGLGLAIARRAVESWGGRIWAESQPGRGSTFFFTVGVRS